MDTNTMSLAPKRAAAQSRGYPSNSDAKSREELVLQRLYEIVHCRSIEDAREIARNAIPVQSRAISELDALGVRSAERRMRDLLGLGS